MARITYYSTVEDVKKYTGVEFDKLGLDSEQALDDLILKWLQETASIINANRNRDMITDLTFGETQIVDYGLELWDAAAIEGVDVTLETDKEELPDLETFAVNLIEISSTVIEETIIAARNINSDFQDLSNAKILTIKVKPYTLLEKGDIQLILYSEETEDETTILVETKTMDFPELEMEEWRLCKFYLGCDDDLSAITRIGIKRVDSIGVYFWVGEIKKLIVPEGIHNIAMRVCANMVKLAYMNRESPVIKIEDMNAKLLNDEVLTDSLKKELRQYGAKPSFRFARAGTTEDV